MTLAKKEKYLGHCPSCGLLVRESQPFIECEKIAEVAEKGYYHEKCLARIMRKESKRTSGSNYLKIKHIEFKFGAL